ncbi:MAG: RNA polymerase sigma factor [Melioribacteraceae bacterium]|nr:RNA polymerase sigma factor [Melioribacteraceae bacterium]
MQRQKDKNANEVDAQLIHLVITGNDEALTMLINRHKDFIYNLSFRMFGNIDDAKDATQEIWIKVITKLSSFNFNSSFKTWLYRISVNHILNFKKSNKELAFSSFDKHDALIEKLENKDSESAIRSDINLLLQETKVECMTGMLLCLSRNQRIVFILGSIFGINSKNGSEIIEITPENFRKELSRARQQLSNYMNGKCSLINPKGTCSCKRKAMAAVRAGLINPTNLKYTPKHLRRIHEIANEKTEGVIENILEIKCQREFQEHPYLILENEVMKPVFNAFK